MTVIWGGGGSSGSRKSEVSLWRTEEFVLVPVKLVLRTLLGIGGSRSVLCRQIV